jgi:hypothetical protein
MFFNAGKCGLIGDLTRLSMKPYTDKMSARQAEFFAVSEKKLLRYTNLLRSVGQIRHQATRLMDVKRLNVAKVLTHFGGVDALVQLAHQHGLTAYNKKLIQKWRERKSIPMERWLELRALSETQDKVLYLTPFLESGADNEPQ